MCTKVSRFRLCASASRRSGRSLLLIQVGRHTTASLKQSARFSPSWNERCTPFSLACRCRLRCACVAPCAEGGKPPAHLHIHSLVAPDPSDPACSSGEASRDARSVGDSLPKSTGGRPRGVLKCATCSRKSRPCGPACPRWPGEPTDDSTGAPAPLCMAVATSPPHASAACDSSAPIELDLVQLTRSAPRPTATRNLDRETPEWQLRRRAASGKRRRLQTELNSTAEVRCLRWAISPCSWFTPFLPPDLPSSIPHKHHPSPIPPSSPLPRLPAFPRPLLTPPHPAP